MVVSGNGSADGSEKEVRDNSKELLQRIINILPVRVFWKDKDLRYLGCNEVFARDAGKNFPEELIGKDDFQMNWKDQAGLYREDDMKVMNSSSSKLGFEEPQTTPNGDTIWLRTSKVPLTDQNGKIIGILGMYEDITKQKNAENQLRLEQDRAKTYLDTVETLIVALDKNGLITAINRKGCEIFGYSRDELIGQSWFKKCLPQPEGENQIFPVFQKMMSGGLTNYEYYENFILTKNGDTRQIAWHNAFLYDEKKNISGILSAGEDITERKKTEALINSKIEELEAFKKFTIDRELKMIDLKKQISSIKEDLKGQ